MEDVLPVFGWGSCGYIGKGLAWIAIGKIMKAVFARGE